MNYNSIAIVTYGRSGSTLLMGLLNAIPNSHIKGENFDLFYRLYLSTVSLKDTVKYAPDAAEPVHPWYGAATYDTDKFLSNIHRTINDLLEDGVPAGVTLKGFKEIRYFDSFDAPNFKGYLDFLECALDKPLIVLNTRNHEAVSNSGWWRNHDATQLMSRLDKFEHAIREECAGKENFYEIDMSDLTSKSDRLYGLLEKLGVAEDLVQIDSVIEKRHSTA